MEHKQQCKRTGPHKAHDWWRPQPGWSSARPDLCRCRGERDWGVVFLVSLWALLVCVFMMLGAWEVGR